MEMTDVQWAIIEPLIPKSQRRKDRADYRKALEIEPSDQDAKEGLKRLGVTH